MLAIHHISLNYANQQVLKDVSFSLNAGGIIGIVGQSGVGKSSLLKIIAGLQDATSGEISLNEKRVVGPSQRLIPGHPDIQLVNQDFALDEYQTVEENIRGKILHFSKSTQDSFVKELLELVEMQHLATHLAHTLSGGEQQRLAIARALALEPQVLLLDEPFVHLDYQLRHRLIHYLLQLKEIRNCGIIIVSHNNEELLSLCDQLIFLQKGIIKRIASPFDFYYRYKTLTEGRMFGIVNRIKVNEVMVTFRPDEFEVVDEKEQGIQVELLKSIFMGSYFLNEFRHEKSTVTLIHNTQLKDVKRIRVVKK